MAIWNDMDTVHRDGTAVVLLTNCRAWAVTMGVWHEPYKMWLVKLGGDEIIGIPDARALKWMPLDEDEEPYYIPTDLPDDVVFLVKLEAGDGNVTV